jgi:hypothetical protein
MGLSYRHPFCAKLVLSAETKREEARNRRPPKHVQRRPIVAQHRGHFIHAAKE